MRPPYHGGCQCGGVRYTITGEPAVVYACHCTICQTQSGSAFGLSMRVPANYFRLTKGTLKSFQRTAESGQVFTNSFCPDCGTRIHNQPDRSHDQVSLKPGTLDDTSWLRPTPTSSCTAPSPGSSSPTTPKPTIPCPRAATG